MMGSAVKKIKPSVIHRTWGLDSAGWRGEDFCEEATFDSRRNQPAVNWERCSPSRGKSQYNTLGQEYMLRR